MNSNIESRRTFLGISSFQALAMFRRGLFYSYLSIYLRFFLGLSVTETTFFATFPMILNIVFQTFVWGVISDKYQKRRTLIILGEVFAAISTFFVWFLHTMPASKYAAGYIIIFGMSFVEIFWSMSNIGWSAIISDLYPEHRRTEIQGKLTSIGALGRIIGVWIGGVAYDGLAHLYEGWGFDKGLLFFIASGIMLLSTIPMFFVPEGGVKVIKDRAAEQLKRPDQPKKVSSYTGVFLFFLLAMVFINFGRNSIALIITQYLSLDQGFNVSSSLLSYIVNMQSLAMFIGGIFVAKLSKKFNDTALLMFGSITAVIHLLGFMLGTTLIIIFISNFLGGISMVIITASAYSYVSRLIPPEKRGKQFALFNATFFLSWGVAGTLIAGPVVDILLKSGANQIFSYQMSFLSAAVLVIIGIVIFIFVDRMAREKAAQSVF
ncbi:MAG: MFS transporter [bacterium]